MRQHSVRAVAILFASALAASAWGAERVKTVDGVVEGVMEKSGIRTFLGIPFAAPPVGDLRWKPPQPVKNWEGVRRADQFRPRAMQRPIFGDMNFRSDGMSEDCLYLNVWTPAKSGDERLPVLVYFYGGGFVAGDGSEPRYDGASMASKGHRGRDRQLPPRRLRLLRPPRADQGVAAPRLGQLRPARPARGAGAGCRRNIAAFGGDPDKVTIAGESAGSISVSAQMASPLSKDLIAGAIGESGSLMGTLPPVPLSEAEESGARFAAKLEAKSLADLRKIPAEKLLEATAARASAASRWPSMAISSPSSPLTSSPQASRRRCPLLVGWNSEEMNYQDVLGQEKPTRENYEKAVRKLYGDRAEEVLKHYAATDEQTSSKRRPTWPVTASSV